MKYVSCNTFPPVIVVMSDHQVAPPTSKPRRRNRPPLSVAEHGADLPAEHGESVGDVNRAYLVGVGLRWWPWGCLWIDLVGGCW